jgi:hypothetical protein
MRRWRVVQWATGTAGSIALRALIRRPEFELVGVLVHSAAKEGCDAAELAGIDGKSGIFATRDAKALLALEPDCVSYMAHGETRARQCIDDYCQILDSGANVVTTSVPGLIYGPGFDAKSRERLERACHGGGSSLFCSGIEPGFAGDLLPLTLASMSESIESIRTQELFSYADYPVPTTLFDVFGFGKPLDHKPPLAHPGVIRSAWGPPIQMLAAGLGVELEAIRETFEVAPAPRALDVAAGRIEAGTIGALRFETIGVVGGRDALVIEHVNRMHADVAPHWPSAARDGVYRVIIEGKPTLSCELAVGNPEDFSLQGMIATAMRAVNAIPYVCEAAPGLVSALELPLTAPQTALRLT